MTDHTPPLVPSDQLPPVRTQADLHLLWRRLMGRLGFAAPQIWALLLDDGRLLRPIKLEELPYAPSPDADVRIGCFAEMLMGIGGDLDADVRLAFLFARPGGATRTPADLAWARLLAPHSPWPVHLANDRELTVASPDDLGVDRTA